MSVFDQQFRNKRDEAIKELHLEKFSVEIEEGNSFTLQKEGNKVKIVCRKPNQAFLALRVLRMRQNEDNFYHSFLKAFDLQFMADCSRNAVPNVPALKRLIDKLAYLGYDALILYMEDVFEIGSDPYFGHMRGRYSEEELREIVSYADSYGLNVIPAVQTLAHMNQYLKWRGSAELKDCDDILLCGSEKTYALIDDIFASLARVFPCKKVMIGMDEAHNLGRGRYEQLFGRREKSEIFFEHLQRVSALLKKYGKTGMMWSDSLFAALGIAYFDDDPDKEIGLDFARRFPENIEPIYWNYGQEKEEVYYRKLLQHRPLGNAVHNASSTVGPGNIAPMNDLALRYLEPSMRASERAGAASFNLYHWGDDGAELSVFAAMPSICRASSYCYRLDEKAWFAENCGMPLGDFLLADELNRPYDDKNKFDFDIAEYFKNTAKYLFYNDLLLGLLDANAEDCYAKNYAETAEKLEKVKGGEFQYLFDTFITLAKLLAKKATAGRELKKLYDEKDRAGLGAFVGRLEEIRDLLSAFTEKFTKQWLADNKPFGLEVFQIRSGGLLARTDYCIKKVRSYAEGEIPIIEELEENRLPFDKNFDEKNPEIPFALYGDIVTAGKLV